METTQQTYKILVLDANQRAALAVVRSLGKCKSFQVITADETTQALAGESRYSCEYLCCPSSKTQPEEFLHWLQTTWTQRQLALVIPVTEISSQLILRNQPRLAGIRLPFTDYQNLMRLAHKGQLLRLASGLGLELPTSYEYQQFSEVDFAGLQYPLILKPCLSKIFLDTHWLSTQVELIESESALRQAFNTHPELEHCGFLLQEFIPGKGAGVFCLFHQGRALAMFAHKRLREKPPQGGVSVLSESAPIDPQLQAQATKLLTAVNWQGVAMVEFRVTPEGKAYLMEVNTRFWGSLQLSIDAGVDFPLLLAKSALGLDVEAPTNYRLGQKLRWLLGDLDSLYLFLRSTASIGDKFRQLIKFITPDFFNTRHELDRWEDMAPAWFEVKQYLRQLTGK